MTQNNINLEIEIKSILGELNGKCYEASEAYYHMRGGKFAGFTPCVVDLPEGLEHSTHWYLRYRNGDIIDITKEQYNFDIDYTKGKGCGFLTKQPSKKAQKIINEVLRRRND